MSYILKLERLSKSYSTGEVEVPLLKDISVEVCRGKLSVLSGRSGSGKSSLLNIIAGLDEPNSGEIFIAETSLSKLSAEQRAEFRLHRLGLVFQFFNLLPTLTLLDNVCLPHVIAGHSWRRAKEKAEELMEKVGIRHLGGQYPNQVSGGEMQRAAIARAMVNDPELILADEPTGNLDETTARGVQSLFHKLVRETRCSLFIVTHDERFISEADEHYHLEHGHLSIVKRQEL